MQSETFTTRTPILGCRPDFSTISMSFNTSTTILESLTGKEERIANLQRPLVTQKFTAVNLDEDSGYTRRVLENRGERPMAVPLWFDAVYVKNPDPTKDGVAAGDSVIPCDAKNRLFHWFRYALLWTDPFNYEPVVIVDIEDGQVILDSDVRVSNSHRNGSYLVPLAFGRVKIPESKYRNARISTVEVSFNEMAGIESWSTATAGKTGFAAIEDITARASMRTGYEYAENNYSDFLIRPEWGENPRQSAVDDLFFEPLDVGAPHPYMAYDINRRTLKFQFKLHRDEFQKFLDFFQHYDGCKESFWIPTWTHDYSVKETSESLTSFALAQSNSWRMPERYSSFYGFKDGQLIRFNGELNNLDVFSGTATAVEGGPTLPEGGLEAGTWLCGAIKARFRDDELKVSYLGANLFKVTVEFIEVLTSGDSMSKMAYLYCFKHGSDISFWANWGYAIRTKPYEGDLKPYSTWRAADVVHEDVKHSEEMMGEEIRVTVSGVLRNYITSKLNDSLPIEVEILKLNIDDYTPTATSRSASTNEPTSIFKGVVVQSDISEHGETELTVSSKLRVLERDMPCLLLQRQCNAIQYGSRCGLNKAEWQATATISKVDVRRVKYSNLLWGHTVKKDIYSDATGTMNWAGSSFELGDKKYIIIHQETENGEDFFDLHDDLPATLPTSSITINPWCDKTIQMCRCRFNNVANFRGFPWLPNNNPVDNLATDDNSVGKK